MAKRLTELAAARLRPVPGKRLVRYDGLVPGLQLRVSPGGVRSWSLHYRVGGRLRRLTLGRHPEVSLAEARKRARAALEKVDQGIDPAGGRRERQRRDRDTVRAICEQYGALHLRRNKLRSAADVERMLKSAVLPAWGDRPIQSITKRDALDLLDEVAGRAPVRANRVASLLKRIFTWAVEREVIAASPLVGLKPPAKEKARERVLSDDEMAAIWRGCDRLGWPHGSITRLLILTAARRGEVCGMAWTELDLERGLWTKPASRVKGGREHVLPLSTAAVELIQSLPVVDGSALVFPARTGAGPVSSLSGPKGRLDKLSGVAGWRLHDIRRSTASGLARLGVDVLTIAAILDHSPAALVGVTSTYNRYGYLHEARAALEKWAGHLARLAEGGGAEVVPLRAAR